MSTDRPEDFRSGLAAILNQLPEQELREIARARGYVPNGLDRAQLVLELESLLSDHTGIARSVVSMPAVLREALRAAFVAEDGGGITPSGLALAMTSMRPGFEPEVKPVEAAGFLSDLARQGLLLIWRDSLHQVPQYWLPWEVQHLVPPLPGWSEQEHEAPAVEIRRRTASTAMSALTAVWEYVSTQKPRLGPPVAVLPERRLTAGLQGWPIEPSELARLRQARGRKVDVAQQLLAAPPAPTLLAGAALQGLAVATEIGVEEANLFSHLLLELGLAECAGGRLVASRHAWQRFLSESADARARSVAHAYQSLTGWSELDTVLRQRSDLVLWHHGQYACSYQNFRSRLVRMRHMLLRLLACAGEAGWLSLDRIETALKRLWPQVNALLDAPVASWGVALRDGFGQFSHRSSPPWDEVEGRVLRFLLQGPLYWLGWVELSLREEQLVAFRPVGLADWVWDRPVVGEPLVGEAVTIQQSHQGVMVIVRPDRVCASLHTLLGRIAVLEHASPTQFVYRLDPRHTSIEFEMGRSASDLLVEWDGCLSTPAPLAVVDTLTEWWSRYGRVRMYEGFALLELQDDVLLAELEASTSLAQHIVARISPRLALVTEEQVPLLLKELGERGYMPRVSE